MFQPPKWTHVTLPSVEGVNILRDPPKSITTRRITKVGEDNSITEMIDGSGDRVCEGINTYARGVNPMVEVSYDNFSNNGGRTGGTSYATTQAQAYLPYRIMDAGAFRAPVIAPTDLLPLSRLPRVHTFAKANAGFVDFTKTIACGTNARNTKAHTIKASIDPQKTFKKYTVNKMSTADSTKDKLNYSARSNPRGHTKIVLNDNVHLSQNRPNGSGYTNINGIHSASQFNPETTIIKRNLSLNGFDGRPSMKRTMHTDEQKIVSAVGQLKPGNVQTRIY